MVMLALDAVQVSAAADKFERPIGNRHQRLPTSLLMYATLLTMTGQDVGGQA